MQPVYGKVGEDTIRGTLHVPDRTERPVPGILIIPGFADTAVGPHNMHVQTARALSGFGFVVLRFDYRGQGESDGDFSRFTIRSGLKDARTALEILMQSPSVDRNHIGIVGYSLGGAYAAQLAGEHEQIKALGLLAPVAFPQQVFRSFFNEQHIRQANLQGWIDWQGWKVGETFLQSLNDLDPLDSMNRARAHTLVFQGTADVEVPVENAEAYAKRGATIEWLNEGDHGFSSVSLKQTVVNKLGEWFRLHLNRTIQQRQA